MITSGPASGGRNAMGFHHGGRHHKDVKNRLVKLRANLAEAVCPANVVYAVHCNPPLSCHV